MGSVLLPIEVVQIIAIVETIMMMLVPTQTSRFLASREAHSFAPNANEWTPVADLLAVTALDWFIGHGDGFGPELWNRQHIELNNGAIADERLRCEVNCRIAGIRPAGYVLREGVIGK